MRRMGLWVLAIGVMGLAAWTRGEEPTTRPVSVLDHMVKDIEGNDYLLSRHKGEVVLIVNVASQCGHTPQYKDLEALYRKYKDRGFVVLGFPANNFGNQEPGSNVEIAQFCTSRYDVTFPMMGKVSVKGEDQAPVYRFLTDPRTGGEFAGPVAWNFTKFLVGRDGKVMARFEPKVKPSDDAVVDALERELDGQRLDGQGGE